LGKQDREKFFRQKLFGSKGAKKASNLEFDFHFEGDLKVNFCFSNRNPYFWLQILKEHKILHSVWLLNDLEVEDQGHVKVNFKFLMGTSHFWSRSRKEQVDLTMTLKSMLDSRESFRLSRLGCFITVSPLASHVWGDRLLWTLFPTTITILIEVNHELIVQNYRHFLEYTNEVVFWTWLTVLSKTRYS